MTTKITWAEFKKDIKVLCKELKKNSGRFTKIACVSKGGLIPAYFIANELGLNYLEVICITSYKGEVKGKLEVLPNSRKVDGRKNWLIVDDLVDTGETLEVAKKYFPNSLTAVVYRKDGTKVEPNFCVRTINTWIKFPWE